jgi:mono/diheme cytochrome c family protein
MRTHRAAVRAGVIVFVALFALAVGAAAQKVPWPNVGEDPIVTPVAGPSWLTHLGVTVDHTRLGQGSGQYAAPDGTRGAPQKESLAVRRNPVVTGHDLYRYNCQACHREEGTGAPPEIRSVLGPVQGSSLELVRKQMQVQGASTAETKAKVQKAHDDLLARIRKGGQRMPARSHLQEADIKVLFAYLTQLAHTPHPEKQAQRVITWARLGEHVVKGTCHICHDAVGPPPTPAALAKGAVPSLASLMATKPVSEFVRKARSGASVAVGDVAVFHRSRMPVFHYLNGEDVAAAYMYLATYPPQASARR